jgi:hypothetical protein
MSQTKETAKKGGRRHRPTQPKARKEAKRVEISRKWEKGKAVARKEKEKAGEVLDEKESANGQAAPTARPGETTEAGWTAALTQTATRSGAGATAERESLEADGTDADKGTDTDRRTDTDGGKRNAREREENVSTLEEAGPAEAAKAEAARANGDAGAVRSALDQITQRVMGVCEIIRAEQENIREQQERLAAMELRLRRLEERGRINRDH